MKKMDICSTKHFRNGWAQVEELVSELCDDASDYYSILNEFLSASTEHANNNPSTDNSFRTSIKDIEDSIGRIIDSIEHVLNEYNERQRTSHLTDGGSKHKSKKRTWMELRMYSSNIMWCLMSLICICTVLSKFLYCEFAKFKSVFSQVFIVFHHASAKFKRQWYDMPVPLPII